MSSSHEGNAPLWTTDSDYDTQGDVSPYIAGKGRAYLEQHLVRASNSRKTIVDLGTWLGRSCPVLCEVVGPKGRVIGIDQPSAIGRIRRARQLHKGLNNVTFRLSSLSTVNGLDLDDSEADGGICWRVIHNLTLPGELPVSISEIFRVLKPQSPFVFSVRYPSEEMFARGIIFSHAESPVLHRTISSVFDRIDLYFTENSIKSVFGHHFDIHEISLIEEGEVIGGVSFTNRYLAVNALRRTSVC